MVGTSNLVLLDEKIYFLGSTVQLLCSTENDCA